jgi:hypothetical protein
MPAAAGISGAEVRVGSVLCLQTQWEVVLVPGCLLVSQKGKQLQQQLMLVLGQEGLVATL